VAHAIDKENLVRIQNGRGTVANCIFPVGLPGFDETCEGYGHDIEKARELMAEAGVEEGFTTTFYTDTTETSGLSAQSIANDLAQIGITVEVVQQEFATLGTTISTPHAAPMSMWGWFMDFPDPADFIEPMLTCATTVAGAYNTSQFCDEDLDARLAEAKTNPDLEAVIPEYQSIQKAIMDQSPLVPLTFQVQTVLRSDRVDFPGIHPVYYFDMGAYPVVSE
jgi:ABC-type transport system substrate-binding protein